MKTTTVKRIKWLALFILIPIIGIIDDYTCYQLDSKTIFWVGGALSVSLSALLLGFKPGE